MNKARPKQVVVRLSADELELLKELVAKSGTSQQEYIRKVILNQKKTVVFNDLEPVRELAQELKKQTQEMNRQGRNLNQLVKDINSHKWVDKELLIACLEDIKKANERSRELWQQLKQLKQTHH